ncbi:hypothetical protein N431DRAFT_374559 [Stipitochalara longipes BDJ]|nr:hypothetical protein N431DRAFT_374559 [Stipitochalara longipes BDJ]
MAIDPLTALGLASNVVQFVDFAAKLIGESQKIYKSVSSASEDHIILDTVASDIHRLCDSILIPEGCSDTLKQLTGDTRRISQELLGVLEKLTVKGQKTRWKSFVVAVRGVLGQEEIDSLARRLSRLQGQLNTHIQALISNEIAKISLTMKSLEGMAVRLDIKQAGHLRSMQEGVVQVVEKLIQKRLDDVFGNTPTAAAFAKQIDLSKVTELPTNISTFTGYLGTVEQQISKTTRDYQLLQTLNFDNIWARHDRVVQAHSHTFTWIFKGVLPETNKPIKYVEWLRERTGIFWIHGKPGSGKSTLMKYLIHHPKTADHLQAWADGKRLVIAKFFFWNSGTKLQKSQEGLLRSLLFEILRQFPEIVSSVYGAVMQSQQESQSSDIPELNITQNPSEIHWNPQNLLRAFDYLRGHDLTAKFCFFIDGLDEYKDAENRDPRELIKVLRSLASSPHIKLCLSSRSWTVFKDAFGDDPERTVKLEDLTRQDIRLYVSDNFNGHEQFHKLSLRDPAYANLVEEVVRKAQGVFLWVFLVVRDLLEGLTYNDTIKTMRLRLDRFPEDLDTFFKHIFDSIPKVYRVQSARTFQVAMSRDEPLLLMTYSFIDDVEEDPNLSFSSSLKLNPEEIEAKLAAMGRRLDGRSRGLLEVIVNGKEPIHLVEFLHRTVRDFLLHTPDIRNEMMGSLENKSQTWVLLSRATSLMFRYCPETDFTIYLHQLFYFAQLAVTESGNESIVDQVLESVYPIAKQLEINAPSRSNWRDQEIGGFDLCLASEYGLMSYVKTQLTKRFQVIDELSPSKAEEKKQALIDRMLQHALLSDDSYTKLSPGMVEYLLSLGASPHRFYKNGGKVGAVFTLFLAKLEEGKISPSEPGVLEIIKILLSHGADINIVKDSAPSSGTDLSRSKLPNNDLAKIIISKHFTSEQATWLFSHETSATCLEYEGRRATKAQIAQDELELREEKQDFPQPQPLGLEPRQIQSRAEWKHHYPRISQPQIAPTRSPFQDNLYPIKVDNVNREMILDEIGAIRKGILTALSQQNHLTVAKVGWLSKKNITKPYGSMVVYVTKSDDVARLLAEGVFYVGGQIGRTAIFEQRPAQVQCYKCRRFGHKSNQCRMP